MDWTASICRRGAKSMIRMMGGGLVKALNSFTRFSTQGIRYPRAEDNVRDWIQSSPVFNWNIQKLLIVFSGRELWECGLVRSVSTRRRFITNQLMVALIHLLGSLGRFHALIGSHCWCARPLLIDLTSVWFVKPVASGRYWRLGADFGLALSGYCCCIVSRRF